MPPAEPALTFDLLADVQELLRYHFMQNAFMAGTLVAVLGGVVGYFVVLRGQTFAAHTLSQVGFPGASGAVVAGVNPVIGLAVLCVGSALGIVGLGRPAAASGGGGPRSASHAGESAAIGSVQAFALALGFLFVSVYKGFLSGVSALLFGTFLGITDGQVVELAVIAGAGLALLAVVGRPLLFASIDPELAAAKRVPVRALTLLFVVFLGMAVASVTLVTGALLVFSLLVAPAAAAQLLAVRPGRTIALAVAIGVLVVWVSLALAYYSLYPIGFFVTSLGFGAYLCAWGARRMGKGGRRP